MSSGSEAATASEPTDKAGRPKPPPIAPDLLRPALEAIDLAFGEDELTLMGVQAAVHRRGFGLVREAPLADDMPPALRFDPRIPGLVGRPARVAPGKLRLPRGRRPADLESLAFASIPRCTPRRRVAPDGQEVLGAPPDPVEGPAPPSRRKLRVEMDLLGFAMAWQARTDHHRGRPPI